MVLENNIAHFLRLSTELNTPARLQEPLPVSIELLAEILCCTPRNVKFILRKLEEKALICWQPGRGRGHISKITFVRSVEEVLEDNLQELVGKGKIKQGIDLIGLPGINGPLKERLLVTLNKQMGYHSETESTAGLDILRISRNRPLQKLDSASVYTVFEAFLLDQIYSTLVTYEAASGSFLPALAHMWEVNETYTSYIFYLRKGVRFHHGRMMTAKDVSETLQRLKHQDSPALWHFRDIAGVELLGDYRIRFDLSRPNRFFLHVMSSLYMSVHPADVEFSAANPVGTGPYRVLNLSDDVLMLAAFDDYYGIRPLLDRVEIWVLPDQRASERHYQLPDTGGPAPASEPCANHSIDYPAQGARYLMTNFRKSGYQHNARFRQAMRLLYHPPAMIQDLGGNRITPADSFLPWVSRRKTWTEPTVEEIQELLALSGYAGEEIILGCIPKKDDHEEGEWLQRRGSRVGLQFKLLDYSDYELAEVISQADFVFSEEVLEDDWQWGMINYLVNKSNHLHALLQDDQLESLEQKIDHFAELPLEARITLLEQTEAILRDNAWMFYGCHMNKRAQLNQNLFGLHTGSFGFLDISKIWIKSGFPEEAKGEGW